MKPYLLIDLGTAYIERKKNRETVKVEALLYVDEYFEIDWDISDIDKADLQNKIYRGSLTPTTIEVIATLDGVKGRDSLGGCLVDSAKNALETIKEHGMIVQACEDLQKEIDTAIESARELLAKHG